MSMIAADAAINVANKGVTEVGQFYRENPEIAKQDRKNATIFGVVAIGALGVGAYFLIKGIGNIGKDIGEKAEEVYEDFTDGAETVYTDIKTEFNEAQDFVETEWNELQETVNTNWNNFTEGAKTFTSDIGNYLEEGKDNLLSSIKVAQENLKNEVDKAKNDIKAFLKDPIKEFAPVKLINEGIANTTQKITSATSSVKNQLNQFLAPVTTNVQQSFSKITNLFKRG